MKDTVVRYCTALSRDPVEMARRRIAGEPLCSHPFMDSHGFTCRGGATLGVGPSHLPTFDSTGLRLVRRNKAGLYFYSETASTIASSPHIEHGVWLDGRQRRVLARLVALVREVAIVSPHANICMLEGYRDSGLRNADDIVLLRPAQLDLSEHTCRRIAYFLACGAALCRHGMATNEARSALTHKQRWTFWTVRLALATKDWTEWPKVRGMEPTLSVAQCKARAAERRAAKKAASTPATVAALKLERAEKALARWQSKQAAAGMRVKKWGREVSRLQRRLSKLTTPLPTTEASK